MPSIDELPSQDLLKFEKDLLGFYITSHPLTEHQADLDRYSTATTREALLLSEGIEVTIGGMISRVKKVITRNGRSAGMPMAIITLEDLEGQIDATAFAEGTQPRRSSRSIQKPLMLKRSSSSAARSTRNVKRRAC